MEFFGLDIGSHSIKVAQIKREKDGVLRLMVIGRCPTPPKGMTSEAKADLVEVATAIKGLLADTKIKTANAVAALPESEIATKVISMPKMKEEELAAVLKFEAEAFVPFPLNEANLDFQVVAEEEGQMRVMLAAAPKKIVDKYLKVFSLANIIPRVLETEIMPLLRAVVPPDFPPCLVIDLGAKTCDLVIVERGSIFFTRSIPTAGAAFTRALASTLSLEEMQAEEYKKTFGLGEGLENKIQKGLLPLLEVVTREMKKMIQFYAGERKKEIKKIILSGGSAGLPQMASLLTERLGAEVLTADPFFKLTFDKNRFPGLTEEGTVFAVAIGLAQREVR